MSYMLEFKFNFNRLFSNVKCVLNMLISMFL